MRSLPDIRGRTCAVLPPETPAPQRAAAKAARRKAGSTSHRFGTFNEFYDLALRAVSPVAGLVWLGLWREAKPPEWTATVSQRSLANRVGCSVDTIKRAVKELDGAGLLTVLQRGNSVTGCSTYAIRSKPEGT